MSGWNLPERIDCTIGTFDVSCHISISWIIGNQRNTVGGNVARDAMFDQMRGKIWRMVDSD